MFSVLADVFATEEAKNGHVYEVRASKNVFAEIARDENVFERTGKSTGMFWGAKLVLDRTLAKDRIILRYRRAASGNTLPSRPEDKLKPYRKRVNLASAARGKTTAADPDSSRGARSSK